MGILLQIERRFHIAIHHPHISIHIHIHTHIPGGYMPGAICEIVSIENGGGSGSGSSGIRIDNTAGGVVPLGRWVPRMEKGCMMQLRRLDLLQSIRSH